MVKILFVCHGNICRSPMAEFLMKELVSKKGLKDKIYIESAATSTEAIGCSVYPPVRKILNTRGIDSSLKRARQITIADYENFDYIVCMDDENLYNLNRIVSDTKKKCRKLLDYTNSPHDVADPWYTGDFKTAEKDIEKGCKALLEYVIKQL